MIVRPASTSSCVTWAAFFGCRVIVEEAGADPVQRFEQAVDDVQGPFHFAGVRTAARLGAFDGGLEGSSYRTPRDRLIGGGDQRCRHRPATACQRSRDHRQLGARSAAPG